MVTTDASVDPHSQRKFTSFDSDHEYSILGLTVHNVNPLHTKIVLFA